MEIYARTRAVVLRLLEEIQIKLRPPALQLYGPVLVQYTPHEERQYTQI
jgi:hypothetical protein